MQFPDVIKRLTILTTCLVLVAVLAGLSQDRLPVGRNSQYKENRNKYNSARETTLQQTYKAYRDFATKEEISQQPRQWWLDSCMAGNIGYDEGVGYEAYPSGNSSPVYNSDHRTPFRWNDVAGITAMALGAYILFR